MPLDIDFNSPYDDSENRLNRAPSIDLNYPSSNMFSLLPIDLNKSPNEEEASNNEYHSDHDVHNNIDNISLEEAFEAQHETDEGSNNYDEDYGTMNEDHADQQPLIKKHRFLNNDQRNQISKSLLMKSSDGKLKHGIINSLASSYSVSKDVIYRIWRQTIQTSNAYHSKTKNCGRKRVELDIEKVRDISISKRSTVRSLAGALGISTTPIMKSLKDGVLRRHSNGLKSDMTDANMKARLKFCMSMLEESSIPHDPEFKSMHNIVHIDEKWFYMSRKSTKYYLVENENEPYRTCKNKNFIGKVMFLVAVTRPRFDDEGNITFSGQIGMWPLVNKVPAKRSSVNRVSGTLETKPITSITKEVSRMFLINKVLPAIKEKWPREHAHETIYIQQDNAPTHIPVDDEEFCRAASQTGLDIRLICQPPNSPYLNVLDLGFFSAIQSLQQKEATKSVDELIEVVQKSFDAFSSKDSNKIFLTLQSCMIEIMKVRGSNQYKIPHMKKDFMINQGTLPTRLKCNRELFHEIFEYLRNDG